MVSAERVDSMAKNTALIQGVIVICRDGLGDLPLSRSISDNDLRPYAMLLLERIGAHDSEAAPCKTVADIQIKIGLSVNDYRCKKIVSRAVALVREDLN
jgi:hypothetical protein